MLETIGDTLHQKFNSFESKVIDLKQSYTIIKVVDSWVPLPEWYEMLGGPNCWGFHQMVQKTLLGWTTVEWSTRVFRPSNQF